MQAAAGAAAVGPRAIAIASQLQLQQFIVDFDREFEHVQRCVDGYLERCGGCMRASGREEIDRREREQI